MKKIILNQKSYLNYDEMSEFIKKYDKLKPKKGYEYILFPPILYLTMFKDKSYKVGTQNFFSYNYGSFTGEIALEPLKCLNINYTMVSHPERKKIIGETYSIAKEKLYKSLSSKFKTILFVGELKYTKKPFSYIKKELNYYLRDIESDNIKYLSICYEPSWSVGSSEIEDINKIAKVINQIKTYINKKYDIEVEVYFGGSVDKDNIKQILEISDGIAIGKTSIDINNIVDINKSL